MMPVAKRSDNISIELASSKDSQQSDHNHSSILDEGGTSTSSEEEFDSWSVNVSSYEPDPLLSSLLSLYV